MVYSFYSLRSLFSACMLILSLSFLSSSCTPVFQTLPCENCNQTVIHTIQITEGQTIDMVKELGLSSQRRYSFSKPLSSSGIWRTQQGDAGEYTIYVESIDPYLSGRQLVHIFVKPVNYPPVVVLANQTAYEGSVFSLNYSVKDPETDSLTITYPGAFSQTPVYLNYSSSGTYPLIIRVSDGQNILYAQAILTVLDVNTPPVITHPFVQVAVGSVLQLSPVIFDEQNDSVTVTYQRPFNATGALLATQDMVGNHTTRIRVSDGLNRSTLFVNYSIVSTNTPPILYIQPAILYETQLLNISYTLFDADNDTIRVSFKGITTTGVKNTTYGDAGNYTVYITATDGIHTVTNSTTVTILKSYRPPYWVGLR
jgi:hypothetical protein